MPNIETGVWYKAKYKYNTEDGLGFNCLFFYDINDKTQSATGIHAMTRADKIIQIISGRVAYIEDGSKDWEIISDEHPVMKNLIHWSNELYIKNYLLCDNTPSLILSVDNTEILKSW